MRGLDTNVLVRYLVADDNTQMALAEEVIEGGPEQGEDLFVAVPVICELAWVLERSYGYSRSEIAVAIEVLLTLERVQVEDEPSVRRSLMAFASGRAGLADCLIGELGRKAGCRDTVTFDRALKSIPGFTVIS